MWGLDQSWRFIRRFCSFQAFDSIPAVALHSVLRNLEKSVADVKV